MKLYRMTGDVDELRRDDSSLEPPPRRQETHREATRRRLISMMLSMILVLPWLYTDSLLDNAHNFQHDLKHLHQYPQAYNFSGGISVEDFRSRCDSMGGSRMNWAIL